MFLAYAFTGGEQLIPPQKQPIQKELRLQSWLRAVFGAFASPCHGCELHLMTMPSAVPGTVRGGPPGCCFLCSSLLLPQGCCWQRALSKPKVLRQQGVPGLWHSPAASRASWHRWVPLPAADPAGPSCCHLLALGSSGAHQPSTVQKH